MRLFPGALNSPSTYINIRLWNSPIPRLSPRHLCFCRLCREGFARDPRRVDGRRTTLMSWAASRSSHRCTAAEYNIRIQPRQQKINEMNGAHLVSPIRGELGYAHWPQLGTHAIYCPIGHQIWAPLGKQDVCPNLNLP